MIISGSQRSGNDRVAIFSSSPPQAQPLPLSTLHTQCHTCTVDDIAVFTCHFTRNPQFTASSSPTTCICHHSTSQMALRVMLHPRVHPPSSPAPGNHWSFCYILHFACLKFLLTNSYFLSMDRYILCGEHIPPPPSPLLPFPKLPLLVGIASISFISVIACSKGCHSSTPKLF